MLSRLHSIRPQVPTTRIGRPTMNQSTPSFDLNEPNDLIDDPAASLPPLPELGLLQMKSSWGLALKVTLKLLLLALNVTLKPTALTL